MLKMQREFRSYVDETPYGKVANNTEFKKNIKIGYNGYKVFDKNLNIGDVIVVSTNCDRQGFVFALTDRGIIFKVSEAAVSQLSSDALAGAPIRGLNP